MKKLLFSMLSLAIVTTSANAQVSFGPEGGILFSNYPGKSGGNKYDAKAVFGFRLGAIADIPLSDNFYLQPGLLYVLNGYKVDYYLGNANVSVNTLQIPVNVQYKFGSPGDDRFFIGAGPYLGLNLGGNATAEYSGNSTSHSLNIGNDASKDDIKGADFGLGLNLGYELSSGLLFRGHYQRGFVNLLPGGDANNSAYSTNYGISIAYLFGSHTHTKKTVKRS